jgi:hypothetical protein
MLSRPPPSATCRQITSLLLTQQHPAPSCTQHASAYVNDIPAQTLGRYRAPQVVELWLHMAQSISASLQSTLKHPTTLHTTSTTPHYYNLCIAVTRSSEMRPMHIPHWPIR